jgi:hypothetical protein
MKPPETLRVLSNRPVIIALWPCVGPPPHRPAIAILRYVRVRQRDELTIHEARFVRGRPCQPGDLGQHYFTGNDRVGVIPGFELDLAIHLIEPNGTLAYCEVRIGRSRIDGGNKRTRRINPGLERRTLSSPLLLIDLVFLGLDYE